MTLNHFGLAREQLIVIISDMAAFGPLKNNSLSNSNIDTCLELIKAGIHPDATIVVPTFTYMRKGINSPYIHETTPSETGILTENIRTRDDSLRSLHPIFSFAAIGPDKEAICTNVSSHSYGWNTPVSRMVEADAFVLCLGQPPHRGSFFIHLAELLMGVPYRYTKELAVPVFVNGKELSQPFYHFVKYSDSDIVWDTNRLIERLESQDLLHFEPMGFGGMWGYRAKDIVNTTIKLLMRNIYALLAHPPHHTPWKK